MRQTGGGQGLIGCRVFYQTDELSEERKKGRKEAESPPGGCSPGRMNRRETAALCSRRRSINQTVRSHFEAPGIIAMNHDYAILAVPSPAQQQNSAVNTYKQTKTVWNTPIDF